MPTKLSELFNKQAQAGDAGPKPLFPESAIPAKTLFPDSAIPARAPAVTTTKPLFQESAQPAKPAGGAKPLFDTPSVVVKPDEKPVGPKPLFGAPVGPPIKADDCQRANEEMKAALAEEQQALQRARAAQLTAQQNEYAAKSTAPSHDPLSAFNRPSRAPGTSLFADAAASNHSRARSLLLPNIQRPFPPDLLSYMETLATETLARGTRRLDEAVEALGRENMAVHNRISDYNVDYDRLEVGESIKKAHQLVTGKKALFERRLTVDDVVPHLEVIAAKAGVFKDRLQLFHDAAEALVTKVEATEIVYQSLYAELPTSEAGRTGSTLAAVKTSSSLLIPQVQMLQQEANVQLEDVNRMLMVAIPTWKSAMKK